ncbi:hypothetical protein ACIRD2_27475 [Streptomyces sp. NPDC093595]|uniref:hypothetical protein n=1 Tax=Streptomyces sp. NPDC093595 TaxID=3366045 RepID=UPI00382C9641
MSESDSYETPLEQVTGEKDVHPEEERGSGTAPESGDAAPEGDEQGSADSGPAPDVP